MSNKIFISWHNDKQGIGKRISNCFHEYLNKIFGKYLKAFASNVDITREWYDELSTALKDGCQYAIFILTPQALDSAWMSYEYGVLRQKTENIWCFRFGDVMRDNTPFIINQYLDFSNSELKKVLESILRSELKDMDFDDIDKIRNNIKTFVPQLYSDVKAIASQIEKYVCNNTLRQMIETQELLQENEELKNRIKVLETQCIHNIIDLGLPSGTLWADRNIGASSPEDFGYFVAWGELKAKEGWYDDENYKYHDQPETLPSLNDAATFKWGCDWCMPTEEQFKELVEKCDHKWMEINGINGVELTSKINGNRIFLPAAGSRSPKPGGNGEMGYYWSSSCDLGSKEAAWLLFFNNDSCGLQLNYRRYGFSIRAVLTQKND